MRLTDISLSWVVASAVLLVGALAAVVLMTQARKSAQHGEDGSQPDSWERMEQRKRRKETVYATASYLLLFCCAAVAAALSFHGLVGFGRQNLQLSGGWEYLVPFGLDGAAMFSAMIAVREASHGDASLGSRLLVWTFAGAAAWFNWVHAPRGLDHAGAPQFFAGMSISAAILFDRALKQTRRAALREQGLVPRPLPQIRVVRWIRAPRETFRAWSLMLLEGVRSLDEAVDEVRDERRREEQERLRRKEQGKLDRARVRALNRQHRSWTWGRGTRQVEMAGAGAQGGTALGSEAAAPAGQLPLRSRPALRAADDEAAPAEAADRRPVDTRKAAPGAVPDPGPAGTGEGADGRGGHDSVSSNSANPRLDSLEEKLAEIERQFG
ncbi:DUF2637 domain-containing protein [Streptomyces sp. HNM0574]|uniref:DUF2637 domain-containing protein n=1 Tax=Streptomyces sp. HNM0574 TaxID=2714954 RepID=UPI00146E7A1C|nr:DUF2637 domain-containing protein [Streptomyces sp. HNM0574]NLU65904.1 DUF2637 domain-containing protein [Streptomyces sp. HNM0574]